MGRLHTCYAPVRRSPSIKASFNNAAPRLACVKPIASVHREPGSNSSLFYFLASFASLTFNGQIFSFPLYYISLFHLFKELVVSPTSERCSFYYRSGLQSYALFLNWQNFYRKIFQILFQYLFDFTATIALNCGCKGTAIFSTCKLFPIVFLNIYYCADLMKYTKRIDRLITTKNIFYNIFLDHFHPKWVTF